MAFRWRSQISNWMILNQGNWKVPWTNAKNYCKIKAQIDRATTQTQPTRFLIPWHGPRVLIGILQDDHTDTHHWLHPFG